ncbi:MAG: ABC transporter ATP-binding protein [Pirellulales bacterium]
MPNPLLTTSHLCQRFRLPGGRELLAVDNVSLALQPGEVLAVSGSSGSGKSTLLGLLGALARPTSGELRFDGQLLAGCSEIRLARLRRQIGFVFQSFLLLPRLPIWDGLTYGLIPRGWRRADRRMAAGDLLEKLGLADRIDQSPEELSGGEQQRVAVARALVGEPRLIVADEPTSNLDPLAAENVLTLFRQINAGGTTLVIATHDPRLLALATQSIIMEGKAEGRRL